MTFTAQKAPESTMANAHSLEHHPKQGRAGILAARRGNAPAPLAPLAELAFENTQAYDELIRQVDGSRKSERSLRKIRSLLAAERRRSENALKSIRAEFTHIARLATMGQLAASIGHEMNQPLAIVVMSAEAALKRLADGEPDLGKVRGTIEQIVQQAVRAGEVMRGLRRLTRKSPPSFSEIAINEMVRDVLPLANGEIQRRGIQVRIKLAADDAVVHGDRVQLQQVVLNLIMNALDAMDEVTDRPRILTISSQLCEPNRALITVEDSGTGLDQAVIEHIFESFFTTKSEGMGMGLSICRSIAEAHNGELFAAPRHPHGATFHLALPLMKRARSSAAAAVHTVRSARARGALSNSTR